MSACNVTEDERLDRLLAVAADESQPRAARLEATSALLPYCHTPIPPKITETTGEPMSNSEWQRKVQVEAGLTQWHEKKRAADPTEPLDPARPAVNQTRK